MTGNVSLTVPIGNAITTHAGGKPVRHIFLGCALAGLCLAFAGPGLAAQDVPQSNQIKADRGQRIWNQRQCAGCHGFGRQQSTGPDLLGVTDRRSPDWLRAWLKDPASVDDPTSRMLRNQYGSLMPNLGLTDQEADDLIAFLAAQNAVHNHT